MRALPGIFQRKPWSNEPWTPTAANTAIAGAINTIIRRGADKNLASIFRKHTLESWAQRKGIPAAAISIPVQLGGFGLLPWDGVTLISPKIPTFSIDYLKDNIKINNKLTDQRFMKAKTVASKYGLIMNPETQELYTKNVIVSTLSSDNFPSIRRLLRDAWDKDIARTKFIVKRITRPTIIDNNANTSVPVISVGGLRAWKEDNALRTSFGRYTHEVSMLTQISALLRYCTDPPSLRAVIRSNAEFKHINHFLQNHKSAHVAEVLDWLGGISHSPDCLLSPKLTQSCQLDFAKNATTLFRGYSTTTFWTHEWPIYANTSYYNSPYSQLIYNY